MAALDFGRLEEVAKANGGTVRREADYTGQILEDRAEIVFDGRNSEKILHGRNKAAEVLRPLGYKLGGVIHRGYRVWLLRGDSGFTGEKRCALRVRATS